MWIAVVMATDRESNGFGRLEGGWASFVGKTEREAVEKALTARRRWGTRDYEVLVGQLTAKATEPIRYKLSKIGKTK